MKKTRLIKTDAHLKELLKVPRFKKLYALEEQKLAVVKPIIAYRVKHGLTQGEFAERAGVTQQHISKIENGNFSSLKTLKKALLLAGYQVRMRAIRL